VKSTKQGLRRKKCQVCHFVVWNGELTFKRSDYVGNSMRQTWMVVPERVAMVTVPSASKWKKGTQEPGSLTVWSSRWPVAT
jgi:hypothetical protein